MGDLTSGRAFDNGCRCYQSSEGVLNDLLHRRTDCHCGAPRLAPQLEFVNSLMAIGKKLQQLPTKEQRSTLNNLFSHRYDLVEHSEILHYGRHPTFFFSYY